MLEILFLVGVYRSLSRTAAAKGRSTAWGMLGVGFWIGGELVGFVIGGVLDLGLAAYGVALVLAALGAGAAYLLVNSLSSTLQLADADVEDPAGGIGRFDPDNPYSPPGTRGK